MTLMALRLARVVVVVVVVVVVAADIKIKCAAPTSKTHECRGTKRRDTLPWRAEANGSYDSWLICGAHLIKLRCAPFPFLF